MRAGLYGSKTGAGPSAGVGAEEFPLNAHETVKSYLAVSPVESITGLYSCPDSICTNHDNG